MSELGELFEAERRVDEIAQYQPRGIRFTAQEQCRRFIQQRSREVRVALDARGAEIRWWRGRPIGGRIEAG